jgi:hypothetical protein
VAETPRFGRIAGSQDKAALRLPLDMEQRMLSARLMQGRGLAERHASHEVETIPARFAALAERLIASEVP